jgi:predicted Ser/Thr protein kinase
MSSTLGKVGRYEILRELGRGGMAAVYLARQTDLDREVALKELNGLYARDPSFLERFLRESRVAGSLNHPNIVTVHEYFEHEGTPYIAMEFVDGGSMRPVVTSLTFPQIFGVLEQLCSGLAHAETTGIVHRDLKPENVLITAQGTVKIADFGIAKAINEAAPGRFVTGTGMMLGTPTYMAPEQALGTNIGPWSDLYSLGVMSYEMLVGHVPFHETTTPMAILVKHMHEEIPPPRSVNPQLDPELSAWIERLLVKEPANRTSRASEAWEELEEIVLQILGPRWRRDARLPVSRLTGQTVTSLTPAELREEGPDTGDEVDSATLLAGAAGAAGAAAAGAAVAGTPRTDVAPAPTVAPEHGAPEVERTPLEKTRLGGTPPEQVVTPEPPPVAVPVAAAATQEPAVADPAVATPEPTAEPPVTPPPPPLAPSAPPPPGRASRRKLLLAAGALGIVAVVAVVVVLLVSGGGEETAATQPAETTADTAVGTEVAESAPTATTPAETTPVEPSAPAPLPETERIGVAAGDGALFVSDPGGRLAALDPQTLDQLDVLADPALPSAIVTSGGDVVVANDGTVTVYTQAGDPKSAARFGSGGTLAAAGGTVVAARGVGDAAGRLCVLSGAKLNPCVDLAFSPAGLGVTSDGSGILVGNASDEPALVPFQLDNGQLVEQNWVRLDAKPTGGPVEFRGNVYVPVEGGVAIVDLDAGTVASSIALPATPASLTVASTSGNLFAAMPGANQVAVVDTLAVDSEPTFVPVGELPAALSAGSDAVYVANTGEGTISRLDALTGEVLSTQPVDALVQNRTPAAVTATGITMAESDDAVTATVQLEGGSLPASAIVVQDDNLTDGRALVELWQGDISSGAADESLADLTVAIEERPGRLVVRVTAPEDAFESFEAKRSANGKAVTLVATKTPPPATTESSSSSSSSDSGTSTEPAPEPEPEPEPGITVG